MEALNPRSPDEWRALEDEDAFLRGEEPAARGAGTRSALALREIDMRRIMVALTLAVGLAPSAARAHEQGGRAMGVVERVTAEQIVVKASDGHSVPFAVTQGTRFLRGEKPARAEDVRVGQRAVVLGKQSGDRLEAVRVKLGTPAAPR